MKKRVTLTVLAAVLLLSACNFPLTSAPAAEEGQSDAELLATSVAGTIQAMSVQSQPEPTQPPAEEPTAALPLETPTLLPTTAVVAQPAAPAQSCNQAEFYSETVADGSRFNLGEKFTKTWTFSNTGTCTWNTDYQLVFVSGDQMSAPNGVNLPNSVAPQSNVTVSVDMEAPFVEGSYTGYWALQDDQKILFFTNNSVNIIASKDAFMVSSLTTNLKNREPVCPYDYYYTISFTTSSAGTVKYRLSDNEGNTYSMRSLAFSSAGTQDVDVSWMGITNDGSYWVKVYVETPNNQTFGPFKFNITCQP